jgi:hypothetical protein
MNIEAMKQALEALALFASDESDEGQIAIAAHEALRQAIEQADKQPKEARYYPNEGHAHVVWGDVEESEKPMTQEEWDEHHKQLDKYLTGVEERHIARLGVAMGFRREWVGLTDEEIDELNYPELRYIGTGEYVVDGDSVHEFAKGIETKLRGKNT